MKSTSPTLSDVHPEIGERWSVENTLSPHEITRGKKFQGRNYVCHFTCPEGHSWQLSARRVFTRGITCPRCSPRGKLLIGENDLESHCVKNNLQGILHEWDEGMNGELSPGSIYYASTEKIWWRCSRGHSWQGQVRSRLPRRGKNTMTQCRKCSLSPKALLHGESLTITHEELVEQWHPEKNAHGPEVYSSGSRVKAWWRCEAGHSWEAEIHSRAVNGNGCPHCGNKSVLPGYNDLLSRDPTLAGEISPGNNFPPSEVMATSTMELLWRCSSCGGEWMASPHWRSLGWQRCPSCFDSPHSSQVENSLREALASLGLSPSLTPVQLPVPWGSRSFASVDILLESHGVVVEYDGGYWHRDRVERDVEKSAALMEAGWVVLRVREAGLPPLSPLLDCPRYGELTTHPGGREKLERVAGEIKALVETGIHDIPRQARVEKPGSATTTDRMVSNEQL